jgi:hypothetical protein
MSVSRRGRNFASSSRPKSLVLLGRLGLTVALEIIPNSQVPSAAASH